VQEIRGRRALVTGAGWRLGRAIADDLVDRGVAVAFHFNAHGDEARASVERARAAGTTAVALQADLLVESEASSLPRRAAEALGGLDLLVNSAAVFERIAFADIGAAALDRMLRLDFTAPFLVTQAALPFLRQARGSVINILDVAAELPWPGYAHYCSAKAALHMLTRVLARELAPEIRVNGVEPGAVIWPEGQEIAERERELQRIPLGRVGSPREVFEAVLFLWANDYLTGVTLRVDGGRAI
jgi:NAD(P)-dependent dehydrogenase (short-subunit alcohol dehydrogenase family)